MSTVTPVTPEELLVLPDGKLFELVDGELLEKNVSFLSSFVGATLGRLLGQFVVEQSLGYVLGPDCGYRCIPHDSGLVRKPDVSFISSNRISADEIGDGWARIPPDLAIEVVSPNDVAEELNRKLDDYSEAGVPLVWVVYPKDETVFAYRPDGSVERLRRPVELVGEGPLEGFHCTFAELLPTNEK